MRRQTRPRRGGLTDMGVPALAPVAPRLARPVPFPASDRDGEFPATVFMIGRVGLVTAGGEIATQPDGICPVSGRRARLPEARR